MIIAQKLTVPVLTTVDVFTEVGAEPTGSWCIRLDPASATLHLVDDETADEGVPLSIFGDWEPTTGGYAPVTIRTHGDRLFIRNRDASGNPSTIYVLMVV